MPIEELCPNDFRDVREVLVVQDPIDIILAFKIFYRGLLGLLVFGLQFV